MKKIKWIFIFTLLSCFFTISLAFAAQPTKQESQQLLDKFKDLEYRIEAGISYADYSLKHQEIHLQTRKFQETYPDAELTQAFVKLDNTSKRKILLAYTYW